jgi:proteasome accessory factor A
MLRMAREAQARANAKLSREQRIHVLANNSDGHGNFWGSHLNFLVTRKTRENITCRKIHYLGLLASYQTSSIIFAGQGKVGSENGRPAVNYQISARADFFETIIGEQTTIRRPIVNCRDEPLCGRAGGLQPMQGSKDSMARLHVIFYDNNLAHVAGRVVLGLRKERRGGAGGQ